MKHERLMYAISFDLQMIIALLCLVLLNQTGIWAFAVGAIAFLLTAILAGICAFISK